MSETANFPSNLTPRVVRILNEAQRIATEMGHDYIGAEHVLLAIMSVGDNVASSVLAELGVQDSVERKTREIVGSEGYRQ